MWEAIPSRVALCRGGVMTLRSLAVRVMPAVAVVLLPARSSVDASAAETARVRTHLANVEAVLRRTDASELTPTQRRARLRNLDILHEYWVHGVFPVNTDYPGRRVPYFVDRYGTRCAMAYLIERSGRGDLVARIAARHNNAYIRDLKDDVDLVAWLRDNGLTAAEAARIQPEYRSPIADFVGRWEGKAFMGSGDKAVVRYALTAPASADRWRLRLDGDAIPMWTLTLAHRDSIPLRVVTFGGDSLVMEGELLPGIRRLRHVVHYGGHTLTGTIEVQYAPGSIVRGRIEAALECPGPAAPEAVMTFVRHAGLPKVRCITESGTVLGRQGTLFDVLHRDPRPDHGLARRIALWWRGRVGWILESGTPFASAAPGAFRARPGDTLLVAPVLLKEMSARGLRLQWATTLLHNPDAPRFVPLGLIAALNDTIDEGLAALLVSAPSITRDPEMLAALVRLPVAPDSVLRHPDGGIGYITVRTGYALARNTADELLWKQSLTLIGARNTPPDLLLMIATWSDRHLFWCGGMPGSREVFAALRARAARDRDATLSAALARVRVPCELPAYRRPDS
jgi:hypothetical protein